MKKQKSHLCLRGILCLSLIVLAFKVQGQVEESKGIQVGINFSPEMAYRINELGTKENRMTVPVGATPYLFSVKENPVFSYTGGIRVEIPLSEGFYFSTGVLYTAIGKETVRTVFNQEWENVSTVVRMKEKYHYVGLPLAVAWSLVEKDRYRMSIELGGEMNFLLGVSKEEEVKQNDAEGLGVGLYIEKSSFGPIDEEDPNYHVFNPRLTIGVHNTFKLNKQLHLRLIPVYRYSMRNFLVANSLLGNSFKRMGEHHYNLGLDVGLYYAF